MDQLQAFSLIAEGENKTVDFKRELELGTAKNKAEFIKDVIALANSADEAGYLLVGVDDDKVIAGVTELEEERIQQVAYTYISPPVDLLCYTVPASDLSPLLIGVIEVRAQGKPHKVARSIDRLNKDDVFVRRGSVVMKASPEEIIEMNDIRLLREVRGLVHAARKHAKLGNYNEAIASYSRAIEIAPSPPLFIARGNLYLHILTTTEFGREEEKQMGDRAIKDFSDALALAPNPEDEKQARLGRVHIWASHKNSSIGTGDFNWDLWEQQVEWLKQNTEGCEKGRVLYLEVLQGDNNICIDKDEFWLTALNEAVALGYDEPDLFLLRAYAHFHTCNYGLALDDLKKAVSALENPYRLQHALLLQGTVLAYMRDYEEAYRSFSEARSRASKQFRDYLGYLQGHLRDDILCRCALAYEFLAVDDVHRLVQIVRLALPFRWSTEDYPSIVQVIERMIRTNDGKSKAFPS